jgi:hypothetical protein
MCYTTKIYFSPLRAKKMLGTTFALVVVGEKGCMIVFMLLWSHEK